MDVQMPVLGGFEATRLIRRYEQEMDIARIPIVGLAVLAMAGDREGWIRAGMDECVTSECDHYLCVIDY
jgi:osomolarity two-component system, sensor histidine kinase NIK1